MSTVSRGRLNMATCLVSGSIETTMSVSVLKVLSPGRWSAPMSRMLRRSLPSHGGMATSGTALPTGVVSGTGESVASEPSPPSLGVAAAVAVADPVRPGLGEASSSHSLVGSPTKMQPLSRTSLASMS